MALRHKKHFVFLPVLVEQIHKPFKRHGRHLVVLSPLPDKKGRWGGLVETDSELR